MNSPLPSALRSDRLLAIIRTRDAESAIRRALAFAADGVRMLEISLVTPGALEAIAAVRSALPAAVEVGAGTVLHASEADDAVARGAGFLVTPIIDAEVAAVAAAREVGYYPGAATPTEIVAAWRTGATAVKLFPAGPLGPDFIRAVREPLPRIPLIAVGGVSPETAPAFIAAGAVAVGMGGALVDADVPALIARLSEAALGT